MVPAEIRRQFGLSHAQAGEAGCYGCFMSLMEVYYRVWKDEGAAAGRLAYEQCLSLPIEWLHESAELLEAAAATLAGATLVHKDPEFVSLKLSQEILPLK